ncbi:hypothetical protein GCM10027051_32880 [Niabella terrae]
MKFYGQQKSAWLKEFLQLPNGIPSHDTFNRVFAAFDPHNFSIALYHGFKALLKSLTGVL